MLSDEAGSILLSIAVGPTLPVRDDGQEKQSGASIEELLPALRWWRMQSLPNRSDLLRTLWTMWTLRTLRTM